MKKIQIFFYTIIVPIVTAIMSLFFPGCNKPNVPDCSINCDYWAPEDCTFSKDKFNTPAELRDYFDNHDSTRLKHDGDTLKICGWVYYHDHAAREPYMCPVDEGNPPREKWTAENGFIFLVGNENHHGWNEAVRISWNYNNSSSFLQDYPEFVNNFDSLLQKKWYVSVQVQCFPEYITPGPCSKIGMIYHVLEIDTLPSK